MKHAGPSPGDGITSLVPRTQMCPAAAKLRDTFQGRPDAPFFHLIMSGGIDKRILAQNTDTIDHYLDAILPVMRRRGGYIPTCDHGVPPEVSWENYLHYRRRCVEYGGT